jgi:hypothetical protein
MLLALEGYFGPVDPIPARNHHSVHCKQAQTLSKKLIWEHVNQSERTFSKAGRRSAMKRTSTKPIESDVRNLLLLSLFFNGSSAAFKISLFFDIAYNPKQKWEEREAYIEVV